MNIDWGYLATQALSLFLNNLPGILGFVGVIKLAMDNKNKAEAEAAKERAFSMAMDATKQVVSLALDNKQKREAAINMVLEAMPANISKYVPEDVVGLLVEKAYQQFTKPTVSVEVQR